MGDNTVNQVSQSVTERRAHPRYEIRALLSVVARGREIGAFTHDISDGGVFFYISSMESLKVGELLDCIIELPVAASVGPGCRIRCRGRVLRITDPSRGRVGVAMEILSYKFISESGEQQRRHIRT